LICLQVSALQAGKTCRARQGAEMPDINLDKVCFVIIKAREFDV
jgi:hypothetical protein